MTLDTYTEAALRRTTEARVWNERRKEDDLLTPAQHTRDLCEEVIWWHNTLYGHDIKFADILGKERYAAINNCRADCIRRVYDVRKWSKPRIGAYFGGLDHTTVWHHVIKKNVVTGRLWGGGGLTLQQQRLRAKVTQKYKGKYTQKKAVGKLQLQTEATP